ncbi:superoxide dismutase family protein [Lyngbya sp. PCC 8106]|uniref:superoxide dismutase family protein n=1 Tax=Lyngbya sp. (strain PCC 8106) TaxID=313612 RepID=UPI0000EA9FC5|nr:superoxide dismutase family protein [Lyngbya sp. PCC 8106]EAW38062.1 superoxide dismutase [Lyngbya sp. PCC 8106]
MNIPRKILSLLFGLLLMVATVSCDQIGDSQSTAEADNTEQIVAVAEIKGASDSNLSGTITLTENQPLDTSEILPTVEVKAEVSGLPPNTKHGFHIHQTAKCEPDFGAAGGHFDPGPYGETNPDANHPFHMGDLPNLVADAQGNAVFTHRTSRVTLSSGPLSLFDEDGSAFIVHIDEDQGTTGVQGGAGGGRLGCGIIEKQA